MASRGIATAIFTLTVAACGGGPEDITTANQLLGGWTHSDGGTMPAESVTFEKDPIAGLTFVASLDSATFANGTFEVLAESGFVLLYPASPANTTWCSPGATIEEGVICFEDFGAECDALVGRPGVPSPMSGCFEPE
jgi:hypothetical protein